MRLVPSRIARDVVPVSANQLFDFGPDALLVTDSVGTILRANRAAGILLNSRSLVGQSLRDLFASGHRRLIEGGLARLQFGGKKECVEWRTTLRVRAGTPLVADVAAKSLRALSPNGLVLCSLRDASAGWGTERRLRTSRSRYRSLYRRARRDQQGARSLAARCLRAREDEARRIAHELHDEVGQMTSALHLAIHRLQEELPSRHVRRLKQLRSLVRASEERLRSLSHELRPTVLDDLGLARALGFLAEVFSSRTGIPVDVKGEMGRLEPLVETAVYRILQEALTNVARHARARHVRVEFEARRARLRCSITDDGVGFDPNQRGNGGLGLVGIRERVEALGGRLEIQSKRGHGTLIAATLSRRSDR